MIFLGLSFDSFKVDMQMLTYATADFTVLLVVRLFVVFGITFLTKYFSEDKTGGVGVKEALLVSTAGLIRGSIAYVLIVNLANGDKL
jgi:hypothetical protein